MGVLTDLVIADPSDANRVGDSACPHRDFEGVDVKGIDPVKLGSLYSILAGSEDDPAFMDDSSILYQGSDEGPWVFLVPADLVERLARLNAIDLPGLADEWQKTEEFSSLYGDWPLNVVREVLGSIADRSRKAVAVGKSLLMWMCL